MWIFFTLEIWVNSVGTSPYQNDTELYFCPFSADTSIFLKDEVNQNCVVLRFLGVSGFEIDKVLQLYWETIESYILNFSEFLRQNLERKR